MHNWIKTPTTAMVGLFLLSSSVYADSGRNVELILDASGSMNGKLTNGTRKITAAKQAVEDFVTELSPDINLSFRAYGHQHHRREHVCKDTQLLVPFGKVGDTRATVKNQSSILKAQGYTPITYVLGLAADDLKPLSGQKTIVLVSDGKETCEGDPCLLAQKLAAANADLVIHTIGFGVDAQTRSQLQCIARVARGNYYDANNASDLTNSMESAAFVEAPETEEITIKIKKNVPGELIIENGEYHQVFDAETGKKVTTIGTADKGRTELPAGIYNVKFGDDLLWKSIEVRAGETTTIRAGVLTINNNQYHQVRDPETGHKYVTYGNNEKAIPLPPGRYDITFDDAIWHNVELMEGQTTLLDPAILKFAHHKYHSILDPVSGDKLATFSSSDKWKALPPGTYDITFDKAIWKGVELKEGEETLVEPAVLTINNSQYHHVKDAQTGKRAVSYSTSDKNVLLPPGKYDVMFDKVAWPIDVKKGEQKMLNPGGIAIRPKAYTKVRTPDGKLATTITTSSEQGMLPPGDYEIEIADQKVPVTLTEGKIVTIKVE